MRYQRLVICFAVFVAAVFIPFTPSAKAEGRHAPRSVAPSRPPEPKVPPPKGPATDVPKKDESGGMDGGVPSPTVAFPEMVGWKAVQIPPETFLVHADSGAVVRVSRMAPCDRPECALARAKAFEEARGYLIQRGSCDDSPYGYSWSGIIVDQRKLSVDKKKWRGTPVRGRIVIRKGAQGPLVFAVVWKPTPAALPKAKRRGKRAKHSSVPHDPLEGDIAKAITQARI